MGHIDGLVLQVRLLAEPCLWYWKIRDGVDGPLVESSWANEAARASASSGRLTHRIVAEPTRRAG